MSSHGGVDVSDSFSTLNKEERGQTTCSHKHEEQRKIPAADRPLVRTKHPHLRKDDVRHGQNERPKRTRHAVDAVQFHALDVEHWELARGQRLRRSTEFATESCVHSVVCY